MSSSKILGVKILGLASAVPDYVSTIADDMLIYGEDEVIKISDSTGVKSRHVAPPHICTSDLCYAAAERLLEKSGVERDSIDCVIFVSQTPDYRLPATSCTLQYRLGLPKTCAAFDISMGCSGYVYGLWMASNIIAGGGAKRVLLLVGDTINKLAAPQDRSVSLLFGDAGTATILEKSEQSAPMYFVLGTDGAGQNNLIVPAGGFRTPSTEATRERREIENGNIRSEEDLYMNGAEIFAFTLSQVAPLVKSVLEDSGWTHQDVDSFIFHQANKFMLNYLAKKMKLPLEKIVLGLDQYGNTSSASVPLAMTTELSSKLRERGSKLVLAGFGVGYSWGAVAVNVGPMIMPELVLVS